MKKRLLLLLCIISGLVLAGCTKKNYVEVKGDIADTFPIQAEPVEENPQMAAAVGPRVILHTTAGDITIQLYPEAAPKAVENFIGLVKEGYYDGTLFHYAKRGELTQTGLPGNTGEEERSIFETPFENEYSDELHNFPGAVGMAGGEENSNLSQFYILVKSSKPEDERLVPANLYMNELILERLNELNDRNSKEAMSDEDLEKFETDLNAEIQAIGTDGIPEEAADKYTEVAERYSKFGGAWNLDYKCTVFGQVTEGLNVVEAITQVQVEAATRKPSKDIVIKSIEIQE